MNEVKAKHFAKRFIANKFNASATIRELEPNIPRNQLAVKANRALYSDKVQESLKELLNEEGSGLSDSEVKNLIARNAKQTKQLNASNTAIDIALKVKGAYAPEKSITTNVNIDYSPDRLSALKDIADKLLKLKE